MYHEKTAPDVFDIFHQRHMNHNEIYRAPCVIKAEAIVVDVCQILAVVFEWEKLFQDENSFDWRICLNDPEFHSLPGIVHNPAKLAAFSVEKQAMIRNAYTLYQRLDFREWYREVPIPIPIPSSTTSTETPSSAAVTPTKTAPMDLPLPPTQRQTSTPPEPYPHPYTHRVKWTAGLSNNADFDPLDKVLCYSLDATGANYVIRTVNEVIKSHRIGNDPNFEHRAMWLTRD